MRIGMIVYDMQEIGGLEEYAVTLANSLQQQGHQTSILSTYWVSPDNQYVCRLRDIKVPFFQLPKWLSYPASNWQTKEKILSASLFILSPLVFLLSSVLFLFQRRTWRQSLSSTRHWLQGQVMGKLIGPDRRKYLSRFLLNWWFSHWHPDVIHIHGYTTNLLFVIDWASEKNIPVVYEEHQTPDSRFDWWNGFQQKINKASIVVAVSEKSAQALHDVCGVTRPIAVINPPVPDPYPDLIRRAQLIQRRDSLMVTTVARLYITKGLTYLLEAIVKVKELHPSVKFRVYGDGILREDLLAYASQLGLNGNDIFVGSFTSRNELSQIMAQTDIFVLSSILEGQPVSLVEAMAYGCPIVTTSVGGIPELITDGVNGLLSKPADSEELAQKICILIEDPHFRDNLGQAARRSYEQGPYQPAAVGSQLVKIYERALQLEGVNGH